MCGIVSREPCKGRRGRGVSVGPLSPKRLSRLRRIHALPVGDLGGAARFRALHFVVFAHRKFHSLHFSSHRLVFALLSALRSMHGKCTCDGSCSLSVTPDGGPCAGKVRLGFCLSLLSLTCLTRSTRHQGSVNVHQHHALGHSPVH